MNFLGRTLQAQGSVSLWPCSTNVLGCLKVRKEASEAGVAGQAEGERGEITEEMDEGRS